MEIKVKVISILKWISLLIAAGLSIKFTIDHWDKTLIYNFFNYPLELMQSLLFYCIFIILFFKEEDYKDNDDD